MVRYFGLPRESGVEVVSLDPKGPAGDSGIRPGDIVVGMNGHAVESVDDLHRLLSEVVVGEPARIDVLRGSERSTVEVVIAEEAA
jgi:S1-C subfamily serine protease